MCGEKGKERGEMHQAIEQNSGNPQLDSLAGKIYNFNYATLYGSTHLAK
jgi:hypothetical protein